MKRRSNQNKKILYITYVAPPFVGSGPEGIRVARFCKYLLELGYEVHVLCANISKNHKMLNYRLLDEIPKDVKFIRVFSGIGHHIYHYIQKKKRTTKNEGKETTNKIKNILFKYFMFLEPSIEWIPFAIIKGVLLLKKEHYDIMISMNYPNASHVVAYFLKRIFKVKWLLDYDGEWSYSPVKKKKAVYIQLSEKYLEKKILENSSYLVFWYDSLLNTYLKNFPFLKNKNYSVIYPGFDPEYFSRYKKLKYKYKQPIIISHVGNVFKEQSISIIPFLKALHQVNMNYKNKGINIIFKYVGRKQDWIVEIFNNMKEININIIEFVPLEEASRIMQHSHVLLIFGHREGKQMTSKIFYYIGAMRPILAIFDDGIKSDPNSFLIRKINRGMSVSNKTEEIKSALLKMIDLIITNKEEDVFDLHFRNDFTWQGKVYQLDKILKKLI